MYLPKPQTSDPFAVMKRGWLGHSCDNPSWSEAAALHPLLVTAVTKKESKWECSAVSHPFQHLATRPQCMGACS